MPESSFATTWQEISEDVGFLRGFRTDTTVWSDEERRIVNKVLKDGSNLFYNQSNHEWSFMQQTVPLTLISGAQDFELPFDFGFLADQTIYFADNVGQQMKVVNNGVINLRRQNNANTTGRPIEAAVVTEAKPGGVVGQRSMLMYWPVADQNYDIKIRYTVLGDALCAKTPVPYGGAAHSRTIKLACLAASEQMDGNPQGPNNLMYAQALEVSKAYDRKVKPRTLGYPAYAWGTKQWQPYAVEPVTYTPGTT